MPSPPKSSSRTALSFYLDDTNVRPAGAFAQFVEFVRQAGIAGEASFIPAFGGKAVTEKRAPALAKDYLRAHAQAREARLDTHMELMTHGRLWDFANDCQQEDASCEGIWLYDPEVSADEYRAYLEGILDNADQHGIRYTGISVPGCGCERCAPRCEVLEAEDVRPNPRFIDALLDLMAQGRFEGTVLPLFTSPGDVPEHTRILGTRGPYLVADLRPQVEEDHFGCHSDDPDYYITADGQQGQLVDAVRQGRPHFIFYMHWHAMNPGSGPAWGTFMEVVRRVQQHLSDQVEWLRPSEILARHPLVPTGQP